MKSNQAPSPQTPITMANRFRGFLPVVVDVETGGFNSGTDALLEVGIVILQMDESGFLEPVESQTYHIVPFPGANLEPKALAFTGIDPHHPFRHALEEKEALQQLSKPIRTAIKNQGCKRAILVGHNASFDLGFINAAVSRTGFKHNPFHPFSTFDTVSLSGMAFGQTVLAKSLSAAGLEWNNADAHSALYDAQRTAELFCHIINLWNSFDHPPHHSI